MYMTLLHHQDSEIKGLFHPQNIIFLPSNEAQNKTIKKCVRVNLKITELFQKYIIFNLIYIYI